MTLSTEAASEELEALRGQLVDAEAGLGGGGGRPAALNRVASTQEAIGRCLAILDRDEEAHDAFEEAARTYLQHVQESWEAGANSSYRRNIPSKINVAIGCSLVAGADDLTEQVATEAKKLSNADFHEFVLSGEGTPFDRFKYYTAQILGALCLDEDVEGAEWGDVQESRPAEEILEAHRTEAKAAGEERLLPMADILLALVREDADGVREGVEHRLAQRAEQFDEDPNSVHETLAMTEAKYLHIAARRGLAVPVESEYLPVALLPETA